MQADVCVSEWVYNGVEFNVGDKVKIVRIEEDDAPNGMGVGKQWVNNWADGVSYRGTIFQGMSSYLGYEYEINDIDETGVYFVVDESHTNEFGYPLSALEKVN